MILFSYRVLISFTSHCLLLIQLTLEQQGFKLHASTYDGVFPICIVGPLYPQVSYPWIQPIVDYKQHFQSTVGNPWMQRAICMHCSCICGFWYMGTGGWPGTSSCRYWETIVKFWRSQKYDVDFQLHRSQHSNSCIAQGSTVYYFK